MRHATWKAIRFILGVLDDNGEATNHIRACDWAAGTDSESFEMRTVHNLIGGESVEMPDCPTCALFVDMAMEIRAAAEQSKLEDEMEHERKAKEAA